MSLNKLSDQLMGGLLLATATVTIVPPTLTYLSSITVEAPIGSLLNVVLWMLSRQYNYR